MANLLDKANILITPTAYGDGKIHSAKPIKSLSAEKVVNGDFSNGSTDWTLENGWTINGDKAVVTNAPFLYQRLTQSLNFNLNSNYKISIVCSEYSSGFVYLRKPRGTESDTSLRIDNVGTFVFNLKALTELTEFALAIGSLGTDLTIDNVSVKEVIDADLNFTRGSAATRVNAQGLIENVDTLGVEKIINGDFATDSDWNKPSNLSISNGKAFANNVSSGQQLWQSFNSIGTYKIEFTISNYVIGEIRPIFHGGTYLGGENVSENGIFTQYLTATSAPSRFSFKFFGSSSIMCIENVSVKEVIDVTNIPRINYKDGVVSWLIEPQSTNALIYSGNASQWVFGGNGYPNNTNRVDNQSSLDGETNASLFSRNTGTSGWFGTGNVSTINGQTYTHSLFVKKGTSSTIQIRNVNNNPQSRITYNIDTDIFTLDNNASANSVNYGNGWYRIEMTFEYTNANSSSSQIRHTLEDGKSMYVFGAQLEQKSFATSYIPTAATVQTRLAETASRSGLGDLVDSTEGVLYAEIKSFITQDTVNPNRYITLTNDTSNERVALLLGGNSNQLRAIIFSSTQSINLSFTTSLTEVKQFNKLAIKYKSGDYAFFLNGIKIGGSNETNIFSSNTLNDLSFDVGGGTQKFYGKAKCVAVFKEALTDEQLECLTTR